jgi:hypothetical protein
MPTCRHFLLLLVLSAAARPAWCQAESSSPAQSSSSTKHARKPAATANAALDAGIVKDGVYRNSAFGFSCKIPAGWVLRTEEMNEADPEGTSETPGTQRNTEERPGRVLLGAFLRPPQARGEDVNASIVIAAENVATYPGLKAAAQYFGPLSEVVKAQGFKVVEEPYEFPVDAKMLARSDFRKDVGTHVMWQATLVMLAKGYVVSFTFIAGTEDDVNELVEALSFGAGGKMVK